VWKVLNKLIPFYTVRKHTEDKCILHPFKITVLHIVCDTDSEAGLSVVTWYVLVVHDREIDPLPILLIDDSYLPLISYVNAD
jgi:hypothetical protein